MQTFNIVSSAEWVENDPCHTYISIFVQNKRKSAQYIYIVDYVRQISCLHVPINRTFEPNNSELEYVADFYV